MVSLSNRTSKSYSPKPDEEHPSQFHTGDVGSPGYTGAVKAAGCSPNRSLENKAFSRTFWQHQHLYLIDKVHQFGFPSFFVTISPYEWTFPFPLFIEVLRDHYAKDVSALPILETIHVAHVWKTIIFGNCRQPGQKNVLTYFYRLELRGRGSKEELCISICLCGRPSM